MACVPVPVRRLFQLAMHGAGKRSKQRQRLALVAAFCAPAAAAAAAATAGRTPS